MSGVAIKPVADSASPYLLVAKLAVTFDFLTGARVFIGLLPSRDIRDHGHVETVSDVLELEPGVWPLLTC